MAIPFLVGNFCGEGLTTAGKYLLDIIVSVILVFFLVMELFF